MLVPVRPHAHAQELISGNAHLSGTSMLF